MSAEHEFRYPKVETYDKDGRRPLHELYNDSYAELLKRGWAVELVAEQKQESGLSLPIYAFLSPKKTSEPEKSLWIIGGIHGEESASPNAFAQEVATISSLPDIGIPVVAIFVSNPFGYAKDWRYPNVKRNVDLGKSVSDTEHLLQRKYLKFLPRAFKPSSETARNFTKRVLEISKSYEPFLVMDHHEDELEEKAIFSDSETSYSYAYGKEKVLDIVCPWLSDTLSKNGFKIQMDGFTRFKEPIKDGFVRNSRDGSIDELLASSKYVEDFHIKSKKPARAVFVLETVVPYEIPERLKSMERRVSIHSEIIKSYSNIWEITKED